LDQFLHHPIDTRDELIEAYTVGNRLFTFLSTILPTHFEYDHPRDDTSVSARERSRRQNVVVEKYLDQIALLIDKREYEDCISSVLGQYQEKRFVNDSHLDRQRKHLYYSDASPGDSSDSCRYYPLKSNSRLPPCQPLLATSTVSASASNCHNKIGLKKDHNISAVSDSVDILLASSNVTDQTSFLSEDPVSTPSHTKQHHVVSPIYETRSMTFQPPSRNAGPHGRNGTERFNNAEKISLEKNIAVVKSRLPVERQHMPIVRSHWIANQPTKSNERTKTVDLLFASVDRDINNNQNVGRIHNITPSLSSLKRSPEQSPGGSVRSTIRAWPPKQDPPGINSSTMVTSCLNETPGAEITPRRLNFEPMSTLPEPSSPMLNHQTKQVNDAQATIDILDRESPVVVRNIWGGDKGHNVLQQEPSLKSQRVQFSVSSCASSSQDHSTSTNDDEPGPNESPFRYSIANSPCLKDPSNNFAASSQNDIVSGSSKNTALNKSVDGSLKQESLNMSLDSSRFLKTRCETEPTGIFKLPIFTLSSKRISAHQRSRLGTAANSYLNHAEIPVKHGASLNDMSRSCNKQNEKDIQPNPFYSESPLLEKFDFSIQFDEQWTIHNGRDEVHDTTGDSIDACLRSPEFGRTGPIDLDVSTESTSTLPICKNHDVLSTSRRFLTDGIDYVLPTQNCLVGKSSPLISSYAPSAPDWSIDDDIDIDSRRFDREYSIISIDSTEFSGYPEKVKSLVKNVKVGGGSTMKPIHPPKSYTAPVRGSQNVSRSSTIRTHIWSPDNSDLSTAFGRSRPKVDVDTTTRTKSISPKHMNGTAEFSSSIRPDFSQAEWERVWHNTARTKKTFHSPDTRKDFIPRGNRFQRGTSCSDRTVFAGNSLSIRPRDLSRDFAPLKKTTDLVNPAASCTPTEMSFLHDEQVSPFAIDTMVEHQLRVSVKSTTDLPRSSQSTESLKLPPKQIGLYGGLNGFHSFDCLLPFESEDAVHQRSESRRGNKFLCISKQKSWSDQRTRNNEDWEDNSHFLVGSHHIGQTFKNCVRCLLT
jgi:hypothetical protein